MAAARAAARQAVKAAGSERELVRAVRDLLRASQLSHMGFCVRPGAGREAGVAEVSRLRRVDPHTGWLTLSRFAERSVYRAPLDAALAGATGLQRLLIDLRGNPGGSLKLAMRLADPLFPERRPLGLFAIRPRCNAKARCGWRRAAGRRTWVTAYKTRRRRGWAKPDAQPHSGPREGALATSLTRCWV
jgi:hypothetical protein